MWKRPEAPCCQQAITAVENARRIVESWMQDSESVVDGVPEPVWKALDDAQRHTAFAINRTTGDSLYTVWPKGVEAYGDLARLFLHDIHKAISGQDLMAIRESFGEVLRILGESRVAEAKLLSEHGTEANLDPGR